MKKYVQRIVFMGTPAFASHILEGLLEEGYNIVGVVSQPDKEVGRKRILTPSPVKNLALEKGLEVLTPVKIRTDYEQIIALKPDLIITAAYGQIVPEEILACPEYGCINCHGSLLPKYRGGAPIQRCLINGETKTGMIIMYLSKGLDDGDVFFQEELPIDIDDTNSSLFEKMSDLGLKMLIEHLPDIFEGHVDSWPQNHEEATYAPNLSKDIEHISFLDDVLNVYNHIRGLLDNPGCHLIMADKKYKIMKCSFAYAEAVEENTFRGLENDYLRFDCLNGFIKIYEIKPEGKNSMDGKAFYNGSGRNLVGVKLG